MKIIIRLLTSMPWIAAFCVVGGISPAPLSEGANADMGKGTYTFGSRFINNMYYSMECVKCAIPQLFAMK